MSFEQDREVFPFPGKVKSSVWEYFGFYKDDLGCLDKSKAICKLCRRGVNYTGNTTNLRAHVVHHHRGEEGVDEKMLLSRGLPMAALGFSSSALSLSPGASHERIKLRAFADMDSDGQRKCDTINSALLNFIVSEMIPLETVDSQAFRNFIQICGNDKIEVLVPKQEEIHTILETYYSSTKKKVAKCLSEAESEYMKVEIWRTVQSSYMTVSVQALYDNWKTNSFVLCTYDLGEKYTAKEISDLLGKTVQDWNLLEEIIILSDDRQEVTDAAAKLSLVHVISLGVAINKAAILCLEHPVVCSVLKHVRNIAELLKQGTRGGNIFMEKQKVLKLSNTSLVISEKGSWKSILDMLESVDETSAALMATFNDPALGKDAKIVKMLTPKELSVVQSVISMLKPLKTAYSLSHSMKCPMMSVILPVLKKLEVALSSNDCDSQVMVELKEKMLARLSQGYSSKVHRELLLLSSLLDPRFKDLKFVDQSEQELAYDLLKQSATEMNNMFKMAKETVADSPQEACIKIEINDDHEFSSCSSEDATAVAMLVDQLEAIKPVKRRRYANLQKEAQIQSDPMNDWLADVVQEIVPSENEEDSITNEISRYKSEMQILSTSSPLSWWRDRQSTYPVLSQVAKKYACAPAVLSELDEKRQTTFERQRACLADSYLEMMVFLNANVISIS